MSETEKTAPADLTPPRHWASLEELNPSYWSDAASSRGQEFLHKPIETLEWIEKLDSKGLARREFLTLMGASMALATASCARRPVTKLIPYVIQPVDSTPGVANYYASTCGECSRACGILVKTREGRPIKIEGNPDHPSNRGKLCARGQASLLNLYDPDRLHKPAFIRNRRADGVHQEIAWAHADQQIISRLRTIDSRGGRVRVLTGAIPGDSTRRLLSEFVALFKNGAWIEYEGDGTEGVAAGQLESYGAAQLPIYHFNKAEVVLSLGADFLGTWGAHVEYAADWAKNRKLAQGPRLSRLISFESAFSITGANSDERYAVQPGDELKVALAIAHELLLSRRVSELTIDAAFESILNGYSPNVVAQEIGIPAQSLVRLAHELWQNRGKSLVVAGGLSSQTGDALALQVAANLLNSVLKNEGITVVGSTHPNRGTKGLAEVVSLAQEMHDEKIGALILFGMNPVYQMPPALQFEERMKQVEFIISASDRIDETAIHSDYVLPPHHYLESWGDASTVNGALSLQQPVIAPLHDSRGFQDSLLIWTGLLGGQSGLVSRIARGPQGENDWHHYLQTHWREMVYPNSGEASFEEFWTKSLERGVRTQLIAGHSARTFKPFALRLIPKYRSKPRNESSELKLALYEKVSMGDGRSANNAWLQEMPDPLTTVTWDNYVNVSPSLALQQGLKGDDVVEIQVDGVSQELPVNIQPGLHPLVLTVAVGYGRTLAGQVGSGVGKNANHFQKLSGGQLVASGLSVTLRKTGRRYELAATQGHHRTENRPILNDITLAEYRKNPRAENHGATELRMETVPTIWPEHEYKGYRWAMAIDLNACTGCGACVIACQSENNIPVVGRANVRVSREMQWMRIDRYFSGSPDNPKVAFQPMLCQHCENASCETVCPVLATVHSSEGLNEQIYNRCVGTRYCSNNCPYKVRRFNFFDHWKSYRKPLDLAWNPDITVRTRGIMEKCTFCVQRIQSAKDKVRDEGRRIRDGDVVSACEQTCPTGAIVFGDVNDPSSRVSKLKDDLRAFRALESLNNKPSISYLTKVRNTHA